MFDIQINNRFQLRKYNVIRSLVIDKANGVFGKWGASLYLAKLKEQVPNGIITIKSIPNNINRIKIYEGDDLFIEEWMIKEHIAE